MNKRLYPWYVIATDNQTTEVVLLEGDEYKEFAIESCGNLYAVPIVIAEEKGFILNLETCHPTYLLSYTSGTDRLADNGKRIEVVECPNVENEERVVICFEVVE